MNKNELCEELIKLNAASKDFKEYFDNVVALRALQLLMSKHVDLIISELRKNTLDKELDNGKTMSGLTYDDIQDAINESIGESGYTDVSNTDRSLIDFIKSVLYKLLVERNKGVNNGNK